MAFAVLSPLKTVCRRKTFQVGEKSRRSILQEHLPSPRLRSGVTARMHPFFLTVLAL